MDVYGFEWILMDFGGFEWMLMDFQMLIHFDGC